MSEKHPVQQDKFTHISSEVTALAYEVYCHVYSPQPALMDLAGRNCRGGFSKGELIGYLYARNFPKEQWGEKFELACRSTGKE